MPRKSIKLLGIALLALLCMFAITGCSEEQPTAGEPETNVPTENKPTGGTQEQTSVIKSLTAKEESVIVRVAENKSLTAFYTLTGFKSLSAAQKKCTYTSSDESVVKISSTMFKALKPGTAEITVTSKVDTTKTCKFTVIVKDVYFDRTLSKVSPDDIVDNELIEDGGYITTSETIQGEYFAKGVEGTKMLVSTEITFSKASQTELYPKCGIVFSTTDKTELTDNKLVIFLNSEIGNNGTSSWNDFGVCEIQNGGNWAWNPGVTDANARHKNALYKTPEPITYGTKFTLTVARDGFDFHIWVNDVYAGSITVLEDLFGVYEDSKFIPAASYAGFFQFNSVVKFENYSVTADAAAVDAKVASIAEKTYVTEWDKDAA